MPSLLLSVGSTLYMEPEPVVALNNRETALAGQEQEEEERVLAALSQLVRIHHVSGFWQFVPPWG